MYEDGHCISAKIDRCTKYIHCIRIRNNSLKQNKTPQQKQILQTYRYYLRIIALTTVDSSHHSLEVPTPTSLLKMPLVIPLPEIVLFPTLPPTNGRASP